MAARHGNPSEELFLSRPSDGDDSPTVEPLRIHKPNSPRPQPPSSSTYPSQTKSALPYPDEDNNYKSPRPAQRPPYPDDRRPTPENRSGSAGSGSRPGPNRQEINDTTPRLTTSPVDKRGPGLAERRGTAAPKPLPESPGPDLPDKEGLFAKPIGARHPSQPGASMYSENNQHYYPPPIPGPAELNGEPARNPNLIAPTPRSEMNRFASTASTSTTKATRGSPVCLDSLFNR